jgi:hypothetical protein
MTGCACACVGPLNATTIDALVKNKSVADNTINSCSGRRSSRKEEYDTKDSDYTKKYADPSRNSSTCISSTISAVEEYSRQPQQLNQQHQPKQSPAVVGPDESLRSTSSSSSCSTNPADINIKTAAMKIMQEIECTIEWTDLDHLITWHTTADRYKEQKNNQ